MRVALVIAGVACALMSAAVGYGFVVGRGWDEVRELWALPWGKVSFADVYVGFTLVSGWIWMRERSKGVAIGWIVGVMVLGNAVSLLYVTLALAGARGDWRGFWLGRRALS